MKKKKGVKALIFLLCLAILAVLSACDPTLKAIRVSPDGQTTVIGTPLQFSATGVWSNGKETDETQNVLWTSTVSNVAFIDPNVKGRVMPISSGITQIKATLGTTSGFTSLTVTAPVSAFPHQSCNDPRGIASEGDNIWIACDGDKTIQKINGVDGQKLGNAIPLNILIDNRSVAVPPLHLAIENQNIWVVSDSGSLLKVNSSNGAITQVKISGYAPLAITYALNYIWLTDTAGGLHQINPSTNQEVSMKQVCAEPTPVLGVVSDGKNIWTTCYLKSKDIGQVNKFDVSGNLIGNVTPSRTWNFPTEMPQALGFDRKDIWIATSYTGHKIDATTNVLKPQAKGAGVSIAFDLTRNSIWIAQSGSNPSVKQFRLNSAVNSDGEITPDIYSPNYLQSPYGITVGGGHAWVTDSKANIYVQF